ncbi:hypothetical protein L7F22_044292 [Adiantum nelumboides]|nr:hypothetical protein [Adiantum nelumboides]
MLVSFEFLAISEPALVLLDVLPDLFLYLYPDLQPPGPVPLEVSARHPLPLEVPIEYVGSHCLDIIDPKRVVWLAWALFMSREWRLPISQVQLVVLRRNILRISSSPRLDWIRQGLVELGTRFSLQRNASTEKESGGCKRLKEASYDRYLGDGSGTGGGSGNDGSSWHWSSGWGKGRDEGGNLAFLVFLLGYLIKHAFGKTLIPVIFLPLVFQRDLLAHADANRSPLKPSPLTDENGNEATAEKSNLQPERDAVSEVRGGTWTRLLLDIDKDEFVVDPVKELDKDSFDRGEHVQDQWEKPLHNRGSDWAIKCCSDFIKNILLPDGYPESVTGDYLNYTLWRIGQNIASQVNGVLTIQALLYAVGLGKGAIPTAAAVNWVLKDGIGYLSKILLANYGRRFDVHPKGWRLLADLLENAS